MLRIPKSLFAAAFAVSLVFAASPAEADFEDGLTAARKGNFEQALDEFLPLAESGHGEAQYVLGQMYYFGQGVPQNFATAVEWFTRSAEGGWAAAQHDLGVMLLQGQGTKENLTQAYVWFSRAAEQNFPDAKRRMIKVANRLPPSQLAAAKGIGKGEKRSSFRSGAELLKLDQSQQGYFIQGMADLLWETQLSLPKSDQFEWTANCLRDSTAGQLVEMYTNYLKSHPEEQEFAAAETFIVMMKSSCGGLSAGAP
jgi:TPR repeat protein